MLVSENRRRGFTTFVNILSLLLFKKSYQLSYCFLHVTANVSIVLATLANLLRIFHPNFLGVQFIFPSVWCHSLFNWGPDYLGWHIFVLPSTLKLPLFALCGAALLVISLFSLLVPEIFSNASSGGEFENAFESSKVVPLKLVSS